jgi:hypothetical protein
MALTKMQTLILWALIARPGAGAFQKDIKPEVKKPDRDTLEKAGLIEVSKRSRSFWLAVNDRGWDFAAQNLDAALPSGSTAGCEILRAWLARLKIFLEVKNFALAEVLAPQPSAVPASLPERIRAAYLECSGGKLNQRIFLSALREKLPAVDRAALDDALTAMHARDGMHLSGTDNPRELTPENRAAALDYKGEAMFVIWITR